MSHWNGQVLKLAKNASMTNYGAFLRTTDCEIVALSLKMLQILKGQFTVQHKGLHSCVALYCTFGLDATQLTQKWEICVFKHV